MYIKNNGIISSQPFWGFSTSNVQLNLESFRMNFFLGFTNLLLMKCSKTS